jgi:TM2 domain-containing membrane protein YozV
MEPETIQKNGASPKSHTIRRNFLVLFVVLCSVANSFAQDIIYKKDGTEMEVKVTEITPTEVKYIRYGTTLPVYSMLKSEIFMIKYESGEKDMFNEESKSYESTERRQNWTSQPQIYQTNQMVYKYTFGDPISPYGGEKSPFGSGIASFFIPGLGQFINGDVGGGFLFLGLNILNGSLMYNYAIIGDDTMVSTLLVTGMIINIASIVNAAQIAHSVNKARGYELANGIYLKAKPAILRSNDLAQQSLKNSACGMSLCVTF